MPREPLTRIRWEAPGSLGLGVHRPHALASMTTVWCRDAEESRLDERSVRHAQQVIRMLYPDNQGPLRDRSCGARAGRRPQAANAPDESHWPDHAHGAG